MSRPGAIKNEEGEILKAGGVITYNGKVLLVSNRGGTVWSFPKGHIEPGETVEVAAVREIREETGYEVEIIARLQDLTYSNTETGEPIRVAMFKARPIRENGLQEKETQSKWFPIEEAKRELAPHKPQFLLDALSE